ncbi:MAG: site-specific integrase [Bacteroidota bacterium]
MYLSKRTNGNYYVCFLNSFGKWQRVTTKTRNKIDAKRFLDEFKNSQNPCYQHLTLSQFFQKFLEYSKIHHAKGTTAKATYAMRFFIKSVGDKYLHKVTALDIESFKADRLKRVKPISVNIDLRTVKAIFELTVRWQIIEKNPFKFVRLLTIPSRRPIYLNKEEMKILLAAIPKQWFKNVVLFAVNTGLRRGEIANLKWDQVDLSHKVIYIINSESFHTKTGKERVVPLNIVAIGILESLPHRSEYVFVGEKGWNLDLVRISHLFKQAVIASGLEKKLHFHSLRHTFATWLVQNGVGIYEVQKLLGHTSIVVTQVYSHLSGGELHSAVDRITLNMN